MKNIKSLTTGSITKGLLGLAIPIVATNFIQTAYNMIDMIWIGKLGSGAVAAVGTATFFVNLAFSLGELVAAGSGIRISQKIGAKKIDEAKKIIMNGFIMFFLLALLYSSIIIIFRKQVIDFFNLGSLEIEKDAISYLITSMISVVFMFFNVMFITIFNSFGNSKLPFQINTLGFVINAILDPILIFGFLGINGLGVFGAGLATLIARIVVFILFVIKSKEYLNIFKEKIIFRRKSALDVLVLGSPYALQRVLFTSIGIIMAKIISGWGAEAIAVQKIGVQIEAISYMTIAGLNNAMRTYVGQNYGAKNIKRVKKGYGVGLSISVVFGLITTAILVIFSEEIFSVFLKEPETLPMGVSYLTIIGYSQVFMCVEILTNAAFGGLGKTYIPSLISIVFTSARIPMAILLSRIPSLGLDGIWWTISISSMIKGIILLTCFLIYSKNNLKDNQDAI